MRFEGSMEGKWIWLSCEKQEDIYGEFVADFEMKSGAKYVLDISADSDYAVYIDDELLESGQYPDFPWYKVYDSIPLPAKEGFVRCRIIVYHGNDVSFTHYKNKAGVRFSVCEDGRPIVISSSNTLSRIAPYFVSGKKKLITWQLGYSFELDPRGFETEYTPSIEEPSLPEELRIRPMERLVRLPQKEATHLCENVYDFGEEMVGYPLIEAAIPEGEEVIVSFGEWRNEEGRPMRIIGDRDFSFVLRGNGKKTKYFHPMRKLGLRYLSFEGILQISYVGIVPVLYPIEPKPVRLDTLLRQKIYDVSLRTLRLNMMEHYYDCPWREQSLYGLDSRAAMRYGYAAFADTTYQKACLTLLSEDRHCSGLLSITVPTSHSCTIPSFALAYIVAMQEYADATKDFSLISKYFDRMKGILDVLYEQNDNGLIRNPEGKDFWNFYEWMPHLDGEQYVEFDSGMNLFYLLALRSFLRIGEILQKDTSSYHDQEVLLKKRINETFYDSKIHAYTFCDGQHYSQLINALAILTGVVHENEVEEVVGHLISLPNEFIPCTLSMKSFVYDALLQVGKEKYTSFVLRDIDETYAYMLDRGATSFWETIKGKDDFSGAGSLCHAWASLPLYYYPLLLGDN